MQQNPEWEQWLHDRVQYAMDLLKMANSFPKLIFDYEDNPDNTNLATCSSEKFTIIFYMRRIEKYTGEVAKTPEEQYAFLASIAFHETRHLYQGMAKKIYAVTGLASEDFKRFCTLKREYEKETPDCPPEDKRLNLEIPEELDALAFSGELTLRLYGYHIPVFGRKEILEKAVPYKAYIQEMFRQAGI